MELLLGAFHSAGSAAAGSIGAAIGTAHGQAALAPAAARRVRRGPRLPGERTERTERTGAGALRWLGTRPDPEPIVGRAADLAHIMDSVRRNRRVVLTGPGGVGKTRLALAAAERMRSAFRDGVAVAELGDLPAEGGEPERDLERVRRAVFAALGMAGRAGAGGPVPGTAPGAGLLPARLPGPGRDGAVALPADLQMLLVVDNAEHVLGAITHLSQQLLDGCAGFHLIVTSRRPLAAPSARVWEVGPLACDSADERSEAVELFLRRVQAACPTLNLTDRLVAVGELCAKLDGIPLALEMAALRIRSVSLDTLLRDEPISQVLGQAGSAGLPHQRTLSDSVRWSYALLGEEQRQLLHRLADFFGPFTIEDVERLRHAPGVPAADLVGRLSELVDSSLVEVRRGPQYKYRLLGYVREFVNGLQRGTGPLYKPHTHAQAAGMV